MANKLTEQILFTLNTLINSLTPPRTFRELIQGREMWQDRESFYKRIIQKRRILKNRKQAFKKIADALYNLEQKGYLKSRNKGRSRKWALTKKGWIKLIKLKIKSKNCQKKKKWDGKWRLVAFDIPEKYRKTRDMLRLYLYAMGFKSLQKSVFITQEDILDEVKRLIEACEMEPFVQFMEVVKWKPSKETPYII